jgi:hypothetical protein
MSPSPTGKHNGFHDPSRTLRFDDYGATPRETGPGHRRSDGLITAEAGSGHSGRRFVVVAVVVVLCTWGGLYLAFQRWRASYRERAAYGASHVVSAIDPLKEVAPPGVDPVVWRKAVDETHAMLLTVVGSNLLDLDDMKKLRLELDQFVARVQAHPETAQTELAAIWDTLADRAEFLFQDSKDPTRDRHVRPKILPPRPAKAAAIAKTNPAPAAR